jgi:uncharacterized membrane protein YcjF (UPF0283 family)
MESIRLELIYNAIGLVAVALVGVAAVLAIVILILYELRAIGSLLARLSEKWAAPSLTAAVGRRRWRQIVATGGLSLLVKKAKPSDGTSKSSNQRRDSASDQ